MAKKFLIVFFIWTCSICLSLNPAYAQDSLYVIYNTIYGTALTSNQELEDTYGLACSDTCEPCTQDGDCIAGTCDPIDDEVWIETNGYVVATARFAGYTQSFGYYTDICVGSDQTELFNVTTTGYLTECSPASQNPGDACVEDSDCPDGACVSPYNNIFFVGGGTEIFGFYDDPSGSPQWFSQTLLNVDGNNDHMVTYRAADFNPLAPEYLIAWEDLNLGDADYNDLVVVLQHQSPCISVECCVVDGDCDDFDSCTDDVCVDSVCQNNPVDCSSLDDQCNVGACDSDTGSCVQDPAPKNGDACDDGVLCTVDDSCDNGVCSGSPTDCSSLDDQCNVGVCDPGSGICYQDPVPKNGDPCDDGDLCTVNDTCDNSVCSGSPTDCSSLDDQCNVGVCDPGTGICYQDPVPKNGDPCDDDLFCTLTDICQTGQCIGNGDPCPPEAICDENGDQCITTTSTTTSVPTTTTSQPTTTTTSVPTTTTSQPTTTTTSVPTTTTSVPITTSVPVTTTIPTTTTTIPSQQIPTLSEWGMIIFMTIILGIGVITILRRREEQKSSIR